VRGVLPVILPCSSLPRIGLQNFEGEDLGLVFDLTFFGYYLIFEN